MLLKHTPSSGSVRHFAKYIALGVLIGLIAMMALIIFWLVRPYNDVYFGSSSWEVSPKVVEQGGEITLINPSYCNNNQNVWVERWAQILNDKGEVVAAYQLFGVQFLQEGRGFKCFVPSEAKITLPNYVVGPQGRVARFQMHQELFYKPNPVRTVVVSITSDPFVILPNK